jgi:chromate transporter
VHEHSREKIPKHLDDCWQRHRLTAMGGPEANCLSDRLGAVKANPLPASLSLWRLFASFLRLGLTAFGGPSMVAYIRQMAVEERRWLEAEDYDDGVALCQMIPGATAMQTAAYVGLCLRGVAGAAVTFVGFGLPAFVLMMILSGLYQRTHNLPAVVSAFSGLQAVIVALVANATVSFAQSCLKRFPHFLIAVLAATLFGWKANPCVVMVVAGALGLAINRTALPTCRSAVGRVRLPHSLKAVVLIVAVALIGFSGLWLAQRRLFELAALMARIDLFALGGGFASVPLMFHETVEVRHWVDGQMLLDGIVLGQVTPGPIVITATFIGYHLAGVVGGVVATVAVFLPSFLLVVGVSPYFNRLRSSLFFCRIIGGVLCSFVGLLMTVTVRFGQNLTWDWRHLVLGTGAFVALRLKLNILWVVLAATAVSLLLLRVP